MTQGIDFRRISRRRLIGAGAVAGLFAAGGASAGAFPRQGGSLRLAVPGIFRAFDGRSRFDTAMHIAGAGGAFDCLTEIAADGALVGELAESWQASADARNWTFRLRRDATFHDGRPLSSEDVIASLRLHMSDRHRSVARPLLAGIQSLRRISASSVQVVLAEPDPGFPFLLADPQLIVLPAQDMAAAMSGGTGTGLYRLAEMTEGRAVLRRVQAHYRDGRAGWFDRVEILALPDARSRAEALIAGRVDAAADPDLRLLKSLERRGRVECLCSGRTDAVIEVRGRDADSVARLKAAIGRTSAEPDLRGLSIALGRSPDDLAGPVLARLATELVSSGARIAERSETELSVSLRTPRPTEPWERADRASTLPAEGGHLAVIERPGPRRTIVTASRLGRGADTGLLWPMDDGRIAERWWLA